MSDTEILNTELETLAKYGIHQIKVLEIYNGNIAGSSKVKAVTLFEDKAGDEDGATEGKVHIGDYVNYTPIAEGDTGTESKYKYQSSNDYTGMTEAISTNSITSFTDSSQDFITKSNLKWQVIGTDGDCILITTEIPILPDNPATLQAGQTTTGYVLYGAKAYINISTQQEERNEIDNIAQIYKYGKGADISKARGMTINDVNKVTGVTVGETTITPSGVDSMGTYGNSYNFPAPYSGSGWSPEAWISHTNITEMPGISGTSNAYGYQRTNTNLKTTISTIRNNLIFGESTNLKQYWLASRSVGTMESPQCAVFGPGLVNGNVAMSVYPAFMSQGGTSGYGAGIRPIIYLKSDVSLTSTGTSNKVTTWNID